MFKYVIYDGKAEFSHDQCHMILQKSL